MAATEEDAVQQLHRLSMRLEDNADPATLLELLSFSNPRYPRDSTESCRAASKLLSKYGAELRNQDFITKCILTDFIRPLFSRSRPGGVTPKGRKALHSTPRSVHDDLDTSSKPWKTCDLPVTTLFTWAVTYADASTKLSDSLFSDTDISKEETIHKHWHLLIPPLLTLLDDSETEFRSRGLNILDVLLKKTSPKVLKQTGLGGVLEDAIMPTLLFLPSLTPIDESVVLLRAAYPALFTLASVRFPAGEDPTMRTKFLDRIMRHGILPGFLHSRDDPKIIEVLLEQTSKLICHMGIHAIKHLKDTIPIFSGVLSDPFTVTQPELLLCAVEAIQSTILTCWPRMTVGAHRLELVKALSLSWASVSGDGISRGDDDAWRAKARHELSIAGTMLVRAVKGVLDFEAELRPLLELDPTLEQIFSLK